MRCFCFALLLTALFFAFAFDARALAYETHRWAVGEWPNRVGFIGISDGAGRVYTTICLGNEVPDDSFGWSFTVRLHVYAVTAIASLPLVFAAPIVVFIRRRRRYAHAA